MVAVNTDPAAGGNTEQPDDGRDEDGRLPEPLDSARELDEALDLPGMPLSQPAGTGPTVAAPTVPTVLGPDEGGNTEQPDAQVDEKGQVRPPQDAADFQAPPDSNPSADEKAQASVNKPTGAPKAEPAKSSSAKNSPRKAPE